MSDTPAPDPKQEAIKKAAEIAKARSDAIEARAVELRANIGKWFKPKSPKSAFPNEIFKVISYDGVGTTLDGEAHIYTVESFHPRASWTPPATKFLETVEPCDAPPETETSLPN